MAPPTPGRHRGPRPQVNNNIGEAGRTTNIAPPKYVPRDSAGHERAEDFFDRAVNGAEDDDEDEDMYAEPEPSTKAKQSAKKKVVMNGATREKRGERPDRFMLGEDRGRKTGVVKKLAQRDEAGFEDLDAFFKSPSPSRSVATNKSTVKSRKTAPLFNAVSPEYEQDEEYEGEDSRMMVNDGATSLSPTTYQRVRNTSSSARQPSSLRHSTLPSGSKSVPHKGLAISSPNSPRKGTGASNGTRRRLSSLSGSGDEADPAEEHYNVASSDEEDEDEVVRAALAPRKSGAAAKKLDKGKGKAAPRIAFEEEEEEEHGYEPNGHAYDDEDEQEEEEQEEEEPVARKSAAASAKKKKPAAPRASNASTASPSGGGKRRGVSSSPAVLSSGLMKLDKNGRPVPVDRKGKGKEVVRSPSPAQEDQYEEDYGGGYDNYDGGEGGIGATGDEVDEEGFPQYDEEDYEEQEDPDAPGPSSRPAKGKKPAAPKAKKGKAAGASRTRDSSSPERKSGGSSSPKKKSATASQKAVVTQVPRKRQREEGTVDIDGVRRSTRQRIEPLEYWRNERVIYKRRQSGIGMNAIVRVPKEEPAPLTKAGKKKGSHGGDSKRGGSARASSRGATVKAEEVNPEEGCDDMTDPDGLVWSWEGNAEISRRIAFTKKMMDPKPTFDGQFAFQKIYQELDYLAGGVMVIPPGKQKATKPAKDNSYVFYVIQGSVSVTIHRVRFTVGPGGTFFVPRGNHYAIQATSSREVKLFFAQGRRVIEYENGETRADTVEDSQRFIEQEQQLDTVQEEDEEEEEEEE
ncbi:hypothetical protein JCM8547_004552 [Rhodosporidiobolus lusitaniae]